MLFAAVISGNWIPPDGGLLIGIPTEFIRAGRKYNAAPSIAHGQAVFWGGSDGGIQGVTELVQCERCDDNWFKEVQQELRFGKLSSNNHKFLHGRPSSVPGSWVNGDVECGRQSCRHLATAYLDMPLSSFKGKRKMETDPEIIMEQECAFCKRERQRKCRVAQTSNVFKEAPFDVAPAIFANNDVKYDANKSRAHKYANDNNLAVTYASAKDTPSHDAIRERPSIAAEKLLWL